MLTYDISDDDLPHDVISGLEKKGWKFDQGEQEWRQHNDAGPFSPHRADHVRQWEADVNAVIADLETVENLTQDGADNLSSRQVQNNDTHIAGHGVHVGGGASVTGSVDGVGAGGTGSAILEGGQPKTTDEAMAKFQQQKPLDGAASAEDQQAQQQQ